MNNYACINSDIWAQNCAKQIELESGGAAPSYSTHHASTVQQQQDAASTLKDFNNNDVLVLLKLARSTRHIEPIPEQGPGERHLSPSQVLALSTLKDCPDGRILGWLELARLHRHVPTSPILESGSGSDTLLPSFRAQPKQSVAGLTLGTDATATGPSQIIPNPWGPQSATDHFSRNDSSRSSRSTRSRNTDNHYWCTVCEELKSYKDSGSWKKHEKEHETIFVCGLDDAAGSSRAGQNHASRRFTCKRRDIMVNHLNKLHGIMEAHRGRELADQWRHTVGKRAWSCGFCITIFSTFQDRLKHIDIKHFRERQSIHEWDLNKVILGLLQQPKMENAWKTRTALLTPWVHPENFAWNKAVAEYLRAELERGPSDDHHANTLADAVYSASESNGGSWSQSGTTHAIPHSDATEQLSLLSSPNPYQATSALMSDSGLYHRPSPATTDSTAHLISSDPSYVGVPTNTCPLGNTLEPAMPSLNHSQSWTSASETGTFFNGYEPSESYGGQGAPYLTPNWYGQ